MKKFRVSCARWANWRDMQLPFFAQWNKENPLPADFWQRIWEYPFVASRIPANSHCLDVGGTYPFVLLKNFPNAISVDVRDLNALDHPLHKGLWPKHKLSIQDAAHLDFKDDAYDYTFCISALEEMPQPLEVLRELIRVTRWKLILTTDISEELGLSVQQLQAISHILDCEIPPMPTDCLISDDPRLRHWGVHPRFQYRHIRTLGFVIDSVDDICDCGVIIPHWESYAFANAAIRNIRKQRNPKVQHHVYIVDDNSKDGSFEKLEAEFGKDNDVTLWQVQRSDTLNANVGYLLDYAVQRVQEKYVCTTDADAFPVSPHWLSFPIWLLEKYRCSSVGCDTGLSNAYLPNQLYRWQNNIGYNPVFGIYDNENFTCTNNFYRIMQTSLAQVVSEKAGFSRRPISFFNKVRQKINQRVAKVIPSRKGWKSFAEVMEGSDNGVIANYFIDINRLGPKFSLPLLSWVAFTPRDGVFGQNISRMLFHFALSTRALSRWRREVADAGQPFRRYAEIIQNEGFTDALLEELLAQQKLRPGGYDGSIPVSWYEEAQQAMDQEFELYLRDIS